MDTKKAMVTKIKDNYCMIVTNEGEFKRIPLPKEPVQIGKVIDYHEAPRRQWLKPLLMVASFMALFIGLYAYQKTVPPGPITYITLDINPSIQLGLNNQDEVVQVLPLNTDAEGLIGDLDFQGKHYDLVLEALIEKAASKGYLKEDEDNVIVASLYSKNVSTEAKLQEGKVRKAIGQSLDRKKIRADVLIYKVDKKLWQEAKKEGLSAGKMAFSHEMKNQGVEIAPVELQNQSIKKILKTKPQKPDQEIKRDIKTRSKNTTVQVDAYTTPLVKSRPESKVAVEKPVTQPDKEVPRPQRNDAPPFKEANKEAKIKEKIKEGRPPDDKEKTKEQRN